MAKIPKVILDKCPPIPGLILLGEGKVRQTYALPDFPELLLVKATNRVSAFDFVLWAWILFKGACLTATNIYWSQYLGKMFKTDLVAFGAGIDQYLPEALRNNPELQMVATVVRKYQSPDVEDVFRFMSLGSIAGKTEKCGQKLPPGLKNGDYFPIGGIYTPTSKAKEGHDEDMDVNEVAGVLGFGHERQVLQIANAMRNRALELGLILGDGKLEMFEDILIDEKGTSDSCRFFLKSADEAARKKGKTASPLDKEYVRNWLRSIGISPDKFDPENPEHIAHVHSKLMPDDVQKMTTLIYRFFAWKLFGMKLERYQREVMGIDVADRRPTVDIVVGSANDLPQLHRGLEWLNGRAKYRVSVLSCHRNQKELIDFAKNELVKSDAVVACAGKAAQLPADIKVKLCLEGHPEIPVFGVALKGATIEDDRDAIGSIQGLPGQPVELDEFGHAYFGDYGVLAACKAATDNEFLPKPMESKPAEIGMWYEVQS